jgi:hypothetical protein
MQSEIDESSKFAYDQHSDKIQILTELISGTVQEIQTMIKEKEKHKLNETQIKVGMALVELLSNWEDLFAKMGSNKFNKSSILLFLKETTLLSTKEIRDSMKVFKLKYYMLKKDSYS